MVNYYISTKSGVYMSTGWPLNSFLEKYTENHQKSRYFNIFLLTLAIFRRLRLLFLKTFFSLYQKYIRGFVCKKLLRYLFFFKNYSMECGVHPPPQEYDNFLPPTQDRINAYMILSYLQSFLCSNVNSWWQGIINK